MLLYHVWTAIRLYSILDHFVQQPPSSDSCWMLLYILDVSGGCKGRLWRKAIRIEATAPDVRFCAPAYGIAHNSKNCWVYDTYYVIHASLDIKLVKGTYLHQQTSPEMARNGHHIGTLYPP